MLIQWQTFSLAVETSFPAGLDHLCCDGPICFLLYFCFCTLYKHRFAVHAFISLFHGTFSLLNCFGPLCSLELKNFSPSSHPLAECFTFSTTVALKVSLHSRHCIQLQTLSYCVTFVPVWVILWLRDRCMFIMPPTCQTCSSCVSALVLRFKQVLSELETGDSVNPLSCRIARVKCVVLPVKQPFTAVYPTQESVASQTCVCVYLCWLKWWSEACVEADRGQGSKVKVYDHQNSKWPVNPKGAQVLLHETLVFRKQHERICWKKKELVTEVNIHIHALTQGKPPSIYSTFPVSTQLCQLHGST